ncbi:MAG: hypothetical protein CMH57_05715 [Myxococcales bacterium]|nr:hypothetical protein [Myxococcales bacterium]
MIRVVKPTSPPNILAGRGKQLRRLNSQRFTLDPDFQSGVRRFEFDRDVYSHPEVKQALMSAQHGKCCFCEARLNHIAYGDVEHFRPKKGWRQSSGDSLERPGYYWLAYEWDNLFLSCQLCNQRHKRNLFPLRDPINRVKTHRDDELLEDEGPMFIHPSNHDPEAFIGFRGEYPIDLGSGRGAATIQGLGLARPPLNTHRRERLRTVNDCIRVIEIAHASGDAALLELARESSERLADFTRSSKEYAAMSRCALKVRFPRLVFPLMPDAIFDLVSHGA